MGLQTWTTRVTEALEGAEAVDGVAGKLNQVVAKVGKPGAARDFLSGTWIGHPLHPLLVTAPIGCWTSVSFLDLAGQRRAAQTLTGAGVLSVLPTAAAGLSDWLDTSGPERRVGFFHLTLNSIATGFYGLSWLARRREHHGVGVILAVGGAALATGAGWLGGHLTYALGVGVDTNAFDAPAMDWTTLDAEPPAEGGLVRIAVGSTVIVVSRYRGSLTALADRCSHRGGPLSDGSVSDGCVTCPWHASRFDLTSGEVRQGPAVVPQPVYELRQVEGRIEAHHGEERNLRNNSTRPA